MRFNRIVWNWTIFRTCIQKRFSREFGKTDVNVVLLDGVLWNADASEYASVTSLRRQASDADISRSQYVLKFNKVFANILFKIGNGLCVLTSAKLKYEWIGFKFANFPINLFQFSTVGELKKLVLLGAIKSNFLSAKFKSCVKH